MVDGNVPNIAGRDMIDELWLDWQKAEVNMVGQADTQRIWKERFPGVFKKGLGTMKGIVGKIIKDNESTPKF